LLGPIYFEINASAIYQFQVYDLHIRELCSPLLVYTVSLEERSMSRSISKIAICIALLCMPAVSFAQEPTPTGIAGGSGGAPFSDSEPPSGGRILEVQIFSGEIVDAVQVLYELPNGRTVLGPRQGGPGGRANVLRLDSDEYITRISGRYGDQIDSIRIQTNKRISPVFGGPGGKRDYRIGVPAGNQAIGFIGRSGKYLDSIGLLFIPVNLRQAGQSQVFGGKGGSVFVDREIPAGARISEIRIQAGERIDGIQAIYSLPDGRMVEGQYHGGRGGRTNSFRLDSDEYVIGIYGRYGETIDSIAIRTNKRTSPVFGGRGGNWDFRIDVPQDSMAIGFMGRSANLLDAIGLACESIRNPGRNIPRRLPGRPRN
jgi:hypothetical protein